MSRPNNRDEDSHRRAKQLESKSKDSEAGHVSHKAALQKEVENAKIDRDHYKAHAEQCMQLVTDIKLQCALALMDKEDEILSLKEQLSKTRNAASKADESDIQKEKETNEMQKAFQTLRKWHVEGQEKLKGKEAEVEKLEAANQELVSQCYHLLNVLEKRDASLEQYSTVMALDAELIQELRTIEEELRTTLEFTSKELESYKSAFEQMGKIHLKNEKEKLAEIVELTETNKALTDELQKCKAFLCPRWQRVSLESEAHGGTLPASAVQLRVAEAKFMAAEASITLMAGCVPSVFWESERKLWELPATVTRCAMKADALIQYVFDAHYKDVVTDAKENKLSIAKDKGFVRWLHSCVWETADVLEGAGNLLETMRQLPETDFRSLLCSSAPTPSPEKGAGSAPSDATPHGTTRSDSNAGTNILEVLSHGEVVLDKLLDLASNDFLSSAFEISNLQAVAKSFQQLQKTYPLLKPVSSVQGKHTSESAQSFGLAAHVAIAHIYRLASLSVMGLSGTAYTQAAENAIPAELWDTIWAATTALVEAIPFAKAERVAGASNSMFHGFGYLVSTSAAMSSQYTIRTLLERLSKASTVLHRELTSTKDRTNTEILNAINSDVALLASVFEGLDSMSKAGIVRLQRHKLTPWQLCSTAVLKKLSTAAELQASFDEGHRELQQKQADLDKLSADLVEAKKETLKWQAQFSETRGRMERLTLVDAELNQLRAAESNYTQLLARYRYELEVAEKERTRLKSQSEEQRHRLQESRAALESLREVTRHMRHSEYASQEIACLQTVMNKLERELYDLQLRGAAEELKIDDLQEIVTTSLLFASAKKQLPAEDGKGASNETLPPFLLEASNKLQEKSKLMDRYRAVETAIWKHLMNTPLFDPKLSTDANEEAWKVYKDKHDALQLELSVLKRQLERHLSDAVADTGKYGYPFGTYAKTFTPAGNFLQEVSESQTANMKPVLKLTFPEPPAWANGASSQKLFATAAQFQDLHQRLLAA